MGFFLTPGGAYYEGDRAHALDGEVPQRPSPVHIFQNGAWVIDPAKQALADRLTADDGQRTECKGDVPIMSLINQTRAEWTTWASNNFPTFTPAERTRLGTLFWVVAVSVRRLVRNGF